MRERECCGVIKVTLPQFVGVTFWALWAVDRELVLPKALDPYFPSWLNHLMHTYIMVSTTLEMIAAPREYPTRSKGLTGLLSFMLLYLIWYSYWFNFNHESYLFLFLYAHCYILHLYKSKYFSLKPSNLFKISPAIAKQICSSFW